MKLTLLGGSATSRVRREDRKLDVAVFRGTASLWGVFFFFFLNVCEVLFRVVGGTTAEASDLCLVLLL